MAASFSKSIGSFKTIGERLRGASGAQGQVWPARCVVPTMGIPRDREVALKLMPVRVGDDRGIERFRNRTNALASIPPHPNVVRYYGCFINEADEGDDYVIVQELLHGETLKERLARHRWGLDVMEAIFISKSVLAGLGHMARYGFTHRDIKPGNIFLCLENGQVSSVKLIDFEVARLEGGTTTTTTDGIAGSCDYMSPDFALLEAFRGNLQSDIFSFGVVLHEMLTGRTPYKDACNDGLRGFFQRWNLYLTKGVSPVHVSSRVRQTTRGADKVLARALAPQREDRYPDVESFCKDIESIVCSRLLSGERSYQIRQKIGSGGFGEVFKGAVEVEIEGKKVTRFVAIKHLTNRPCIARFQREAETMRRLNDACFVEFVDFFEKERSSGIETFLVMAFLPGMPGFSLRDVIRARINEGVARNPKLRIPTCDVLKAFVRYAHGLRVMHEQQIIHRDIKPSNLYFPMGRPQWAMILDLGIVRVMDGGSVTTDDLPGTWDYMPPEVALRTSRGDAGMDIYALGLCLYEALTCTMAYPRLPMENRELALKKFFERANQMTPPDFSDEIIHQDKKLLKLLKDMTQPDCRKRLTSAAKLEERLIAILHTYDSNVDVGSLLTARVGKEQTIPIPSPSPPSPSPPSPSSSRWRRRCLSVGCALLFTSLLAYAIPVFHMFLVRWRIGRAQQELKSVEACYRSDWEKGDAAEVAWTVKWDPRNGGLLSLPNSFFSQSTNDLEQAKCGLAAVESHKEAESVVVDYDDDAKLDDVCEDRYARWRQKWERRGFLGKLTEDENLIQRARDRRLARRPSRMTIAWERAVDLLCSAYRNRDRVLADCDGRADRWRSCRPKGISDELFEQLDARIRGARGARLRADMLASAEQGQIDVVREWKTAGSDTNVCSRMTVEWSERWKKTLAKEDFEKLMREIADARDQRIHDENVERRAWMVVEKQKELCNVARRLAAQYKDPSSSFVDCEQAYSDWKAKWQGDELVVADFKREQKLLDDLRRERLLQRKCDQIEKRVNTIASAYQNARARKTCEQLETDAAQLIHTCRTERLPEARIDAWQRMIDRARHDALERIGLEESARASAEREAIMVQNLVRKVDGLITPARSKIASWRANLRDAEKMVRTAVENNQLSEQAGKDFLKRIEAYGGWTVGVVENAFPRPILVDGLLISPGASRYYEFTNGIPHDAITCTGYEPRQIVRDELDGKTLRVDRMTPLLAEVSLPGFDAKKIVCTVRLSDGSVCRQGPPFRLLPGTKLTVVYSRMERTYSGQPDYLDIVYSSEVTEALKQVLPGPSSNDWRHTEAFVAAQKRRSMEKHLQTLADDAAAKVAVLVTRIQCAKDMSSIYDVSSEWKRLKDGLKDEGLSGDLLLCYDKSILDATDKRVRSMAERRLVAEIERLLVLNEDGVSSWRSNLKRAERLIFEAQRKNELSPESASVLQKRINSYAEWSVGFVENAFSRTIRVQGQEIAPGSSRYFVFTNGIPRDAITCEGYEPRQITHEMFDGGTFRVDRFTHVPVEVSLPQFDARTISCVVRLPDGSVCRPPFVFAPGTKLVLTYSNAAQTYRDRSFRDYRDLVYTNIVTDVPRQVLDGPRSPRDWKHTAAFERHRGNEVRSRFEACLAVDPIETRRSRLAAAERILHDGRSFLDMKVAEELLARLTAERRRVVGRIKNETAIQLTVTGGWLVPPGGQIEVGWVDGMPPSAIVKADQYHDIPLPMDFDGKTVVVHSSDLKSLPVAVQVPYFDMEEISCHVGALTLKAREVVQLEPNAYMVVYRRLDYLDQKIPFRVSIGTRCELPKPDADAWVASDALKMLDKAWKAYQDKTLKRIGDFPGCDEVKGVEARRRLQTLKDYLAKEGAEAQRMKRVQLALDDARQSLNQDPPDGDTVLEKYLELMRLGYRFTNDDLENIEDAYSYLKENDYPQKLHRAKVNTHFKESDVREWWARLSDLYHALKGEKELSNSHLQ